MINIELLCIMVRKIFLWNYESWELSSPNPTKLLRRSLSEEAFTFPIQNMFAIFEADTQQSLDAEIYDLAIDSPLAFH